jgi:hypothetical protein
MKVTKVTYEQLFPTGQFANQRLKAEVQVDDSESPLAAFGLAKKIVNDAFNAMNLPHTITVDYDGANQPVDTVKEINIAEERKVGDIERGILSCTDLKTLESYKLIVKARPEFKEVYDKKLKELQSPPKQ